MSLLRLERKQKNYSNPSRIRIFLFISFLLIWNWNDKYVHTLRSSLETIPDPDQNGQSLDPFSGQKGRKNPTQWGGTYLYGLYKGILPPPPRGLEDESEIQAPYKKVNLIVLCDFEKPFMFWPNNLAPRLRMFF